MPMTFTTNDAVIAGWTTSWIVPVIALALIPTAIAYTLGIIGIARLRPRFASLVGLAEVLFAVLAAWALLGEAITVDPGASAARSCWPASRWPARATAPRQVAAATWPEAPADDAPPSKRFVVADADM